VALVVVDKVSTQMHKTVQQEMPVHIHQPKVLLVVMVQVAVAVVLHVKQVAAVVLAQ
jgi:hypothetical protein